MTYYYDPFYVIGLLLGFMIAGVLWTIVDVRVLSGPYRWFYNMTHKEKLSKRDRRGIIVGQSDARKWYVAGLISTVQSIYMFYAAEPGSFNLGYEFVAWSAGAICMVIGFKFAPTFIKFGKSLFNAISPTLSKIEREQFVAEMEDEEAEQPEEAAPASEKPQAPVEEEAKATPEPEPVVAPEPTVVEEKVEETKPNPRDALRKFQHGGARD